MNSPQTNTALTIRLLVGATALLFALPGMSQNTADIKIADSHMHYSHDAWDRLPPVKAIEVLREAGLSRAFVSSSSDEGTQKLYAVAPELIVPVLRPYRARGETSTWMNDETVPAMLSRLLDANQYAGIGEFHAFGDDIDLPVLRAVIALAKKHQIFLHAHSDAQAVERIFAVNPEAIVLWAHSGFDNPNEVGEMLGKYPNLWADLAFRSEYRMGGTAGPEWLAVFKQYPDRFMLGTDTYTPERWYYVADHASENRKWLATLPTKLAEQIGWRNTEALLARTAFR